MSIPASALSALQTASGVAPDKVSLVIRTILLSLVFVWSVACVYGEIHHFRHHEVDVFDALRKLTRILFVVTLSISLVFIS